MYSKLLKVVSVMENNKILSSIKKGFVLIVPILLIGSFALMIRSFPAPGWSDILANAAGGIFLTILNFIYDSTFGFLSAYIVLSISYYYSFTFSSKNASLRVISMLGAFGCFVASFGAASGSLEIAHFGPVGVFTAIVCAVLGTKLFYTLCDVLLKRLNIQAVASDVHYRSSAAALVPLLICLLAFIGLNLLINAVFHVSNFNDLISNGIVTLFENTQSDLGSGVLFTFMLNFLWVFGIHGGNALEQVAREVFVPGNEDPSIIVSKTFIDNFAVIGGCGATICLLVAMIIFARTKTNRQLAYSSAPIMIFNINEIMVYGFPLVLNPVMVIPFIAVPIVSLVIAYAATVTGFIPVVVNAVGWTTPPLYSGYVATGTMNGVIVQAVIIAVGTLIYAPFLRLSENLQLSRESVLLKEMTEVFKKTQTEGTHHAFLDTQDEVSTLAKSMLLQLRNDVANDKVDMFYQPQIDAEKGIIGAEALLRWNYMEQAIMPPLVIALAMEDSFYNDLTTCIIRRVCKDIKELRQKTKRTIKVSVNITVEQLNDLPFVEGVVGMVKKYGISGNLMLEVTEETSIIFFDRISENIDLLHESGVGIAIDDFSMGQTSLKYLQTNHFDLVKLDGSLVKQIEHNQRSKDIIHSIIKLGQRLGFAIVAEYVENENIRNVLFELGCKLYQGYLYSPAVKLSGFVSYYKSFQGELTEWDIEVGD